MSVELREVRKLLSELVSRPPEVSTRIFHGRQLAPATGGVSEVAGFSSGLVTVVFGWFSFDRWCEKTAKLANRLHATHIETFWHINPRFPSQIWRQVSRCQSPASVDCESEKQKWQQER